MKKYLIASAALVSLLMLAPAVSAGGANGGWGKGLLSETMLFYVDDSVDPSGYMYWNPEAAEFVFDFHGYGVDAVVRYYLIAYEGTAAEEPVEFVVLDSRFSCEDGNVHIKDSVAWPYLAGAVVCLVPQTYVGFGGSDGWMPETYMVAAPVDLPG